MSGEAKHSGENVPTFPCCRHCVPEVETGKCWAIEVGGHGCSCPDCDRTPPGNTGADT